MPSRVPSVTDMAIELTELPAEIMSLLDSIHEKCKEMQDRLSKETPTPNANDPSPEECHAVYVAVTELGRKCDKKMRRLEEVSAALLPVDFMQVKVAEEESLQSFIAEMRKELNKALSHPYGAAYGAA
jgi:hypothetical protein